MSITEKLWQVYVGQSWIGTLSPTGSDDNWFYADFTEGDGWGNFAPWFKNAIEAHKSGDNATWETTYQQLTMMGLTISAEDGESYSNPTLHIDGASAWFIV